MKVSRFSDEQIIHLWPQAERGEQPIGVLGREHRISEQTFYRWRKRFGGMTIPDAQRGRELEQENGRLKRLLAERDLEIDALKAGLAKTFVTLAARREGVRFLIARGLAQRRAGVLLPGHRSTLDHQPRPKRHALLAAQVHELARRYPRCGYRRVWALRRRRGQQVNKKHVHPLWRRAQLQVPKVRRTRRPARMALVAVQAMHPGHVWTDDFLFEHCLNGTSLAEGVDRDGRVHAGGSPSRAPPRCQGRAG